MEAIRSFETMIITYTTTPRHNPEDNKRLLHLRDSLESQSTATAELLFFLSRGQPPRVAASSYI
jgi:hypothetical protein